MPDMTVPQLQACRIRVSNLDADGSPTVGAANAYTSDALVSMGVSPQFEEGDAINLKNACGNVVVNFKGASSFTRADVTITLATPDPYLSAFLGAGDPIIESGVIGFAAPNLGALSEDGVSVELWVRRGGTTGDSDADFPYARWVYPKIKNLKPGDFSHENGVLQPVFSGEAVENPNWGNGPFNDWLRASDRVWQWFPVTTLPALSAGSPTTVPADVP